MRRKLGKLTGMVAAVILMAAPVAFFATPAGAQGQSCTQYTPTDLAISVPAASPGQTVTISGMAFPGDTVTIRIATLGGPPLVLGTALVGPSGFFSTTITIPADFPPGTYNVSVTSPRCPVAGVLTLVVVPGGSGGGSQCGVNPRHLRRGGTYRWQPVGNFDPSKPITITLVSRTLPTESFELYSGAYRSRVRITIPWAADNGSYLVLVSGTDRDGNPLTTGCRVRIKGHHGGGGSSSIPPGSGSGPSSSHPPGSGSGPSSSHPPGSGSGPSSSHPPGSGSGPSSSHPPGSGSGPSSSHPPGSGSVPGSIPPGSGSVPGSIPPGSGSIPGSIPPGSGSSASTSSTSTTSTPAPGGSVDQGGNTGTGNTGTGNTGTGNAGSGVLGEQITNSPTPKVGSASVLGSTATRQNVTSQKQTGLAFTGSTIRPFLVGGIAAIAFGALLLLKRRRS